MWAAVNETYIKKLDTLARLLDLAAQQNLLRQSNFHQMVTFLQENNETLAFLNDVNDPYDGLDIIKDRWLTLLFDYEHMTESRLATIKTILDALDYLGALNPGRVDKIFGDIEATIAITANDDWIDAYLEQYLRSIQSFSFFTDDQEKKQLLETYRESIDHLIFIGLSFDELLTFDKKTLALFCSKINENNANFIALYLQLDSNVSALIFYTTYLSQPTFTMLDAIASALSEYNALNPINIQAIAAQFITPNNGTSDSDDVFYARQLQACFELIEKLDQHGKKIHYINELNIPLITFVQMDNFTLLLNKVDDGNIQVLKYFCTTLNFNIACFLDQINMQLLLDVTALLVDSSNNISTENQNRLAVHSTEILQRLKGTTHYGIEYAYHFLNQLKQDLISSNSPITATSIQIPGFFGWNQAPRENPSQGDKATTDMTINL